MNKRLWICMAFAVTLSISGCREKENAMPASARAASAGPIKRAPVATPVEPAAAPTISSTENAHAMVQTMTACLMKSREQWMAESIPEKQLREIFGDPSWIEKVKPDDLRSAYSTVLDLSASQHTVAAQKLMQATNAIAGSAAPPQALEIERLMNDQYSSHVPDDMDGVDASFRKALVDAEKQMKAAAPDIVAIAPKYRMYAQLGVEGRVYTDAFASSCGDEAMAAAPADERTRYASAIAKTEAPVK